MILRRIRIEQFRCHNLPIDIPFDEKLTIVEGPNAIGKSTVFEALQYVLFRRSNAAARDITALAPWDTSGLTPTVELEFAHAGAEYRLRKQFGRNGTTRLEKQNAAGVFVPFVGEQAETFISEIFANVSAARGAQSGMTPQQQGLAHVLFTPQAAIPILDTANVDLGADARARLTQIVGSASQTPAAAHLSAAIRARYEEQVCRRGVRRGSAVAVAETALGSAQGETARARAAVATFDATLARLTTIEGEAREATAVAAAAQAAADEGRPRFEEAARTERAFRDAETEHAGAVACYNRLVEEKRRFEEAANKRAELEPKRARLLAELSVAVAEYQRLEAVHAAAHAALEAATKPTPEIEQLRAAVTAARHRETLGAELSALEQRLESVRGLQSARADLERDLGALGALGSASQRDLAKLQNLVSRETELAARISAAETFVSFEPEREVVVTYDDGILSHNTTHGPGDAFSGRSARTQTLRIEGVGTFVVRGPAGDAETLSEERNACGAEIAGFEAKFGTRDPYVLQDRLLRIATLKRELATNSAALKRELGDDTEAELTARASALREDLAGRAGEPVDVLEQRVAAAQQAVDAASEQAHVAFRDAATAVRDAGQRRELARKACETFDSGNWRNVELELATLTRDGASEAERTQRVAAAYRAKDSAEQVLAAAKAAHAPYAGGESPLAALQRLNDEAQRTALAAQRACDEASRLRGEIAAMRDTAPDAELVRCEEEEARLRAALDDARTSLDALTLLHELAGEEEAQRVAAFGRPVLDRVAPWSERVTGNRLDSCELDANIALGRVRFAGVTQPIGLGELSQGTRDQLGLLVRLALASLLTQPDCLGPMPVLLDDPLAHTDAKRRRATIEIIREVCRTAQVVVFTCRPEEYAGAGGSFVTMSPHGGGSLPGSQEVA
jgi:recombinational DNA repair ATPase RecF